MSEWLSSVGGLVGLGVLLSKWVLIGFSMASVAVVAERLWMLRRLRLAEARDFAEMRAAFKRIDEPALRFLSSNSLAPSASVLAVGLEHRHESEARLREATAQETSAQIDALQHNLPILATTASTAPYVGLFGTVLGILAAFRDIARTGQTGASVVAGGISEALTATALGLGVAIPAVIAYNYFSSRVNTLGAQIETHSSEISEHLATRKEIHATS